MALRKEGGGVGVIKRITGIGEVDSGMSVGEPKGVVSDREKEEREDRDSNRAKSCEALKAKKRRLTFI